MNIKNIQMEEKLNSYIEQNHLVELQTIQGNIKLMGATANMEKNRVKIVVDMNGEEYAIMYCEKDCITKVSIEHIESILDHDACWYLLKNNYVGTHHEGTIVYLHQYLMNLWGQGKGTVSIDHINRDKLDNRLQNLRHASSSVQNTNMGKKNRQYNAQELPAGITHDMLPKYVYYSTEILHKGSEKEYTRDFFRIEKHPNLHKKCISSSKSNKISIQEKLEQIKKILFNLNQGMNPQPAKELPPYYRLHTAKDKHFLIYERRINGQRQNLKMVLPSNYNISSELEKLKEKIRLKYNISTPQPCTTASHP